MLLAHPVVAQAPSFEELTLEDCPWIERHYNIGQSDHVDLGQGRVSFVQGAEASEWLVVMDCASGDRVLLFMALYHCMVDPSCRTYDVRQETLLHYEAWVASGAVDLRELEQSASSVAGGTRYVEARNFQTCACEIAYPDLGEYEYGLRDAISEDRDWWEELYRYNVLGE